VKTRTLPLREVLAELARTLATKPSESHKLVYGSAKPLQQTVDTLGKHRGYAWIGIYVAAGEQLVCQAYRGTRPRNGKVKFGEGPVGAAAKSGYMKLISNSSAKTISASSAKTISDSSAKNQGLAESTSEMLMPIKMGSRVLGVIDAHVARPAGFSYQDQVLLRKTSILLARFLTSAGKALVRKLREDAGAKGYGRSASPEPSTGEQRGYKPRSERVATAASRKAAAGEMPRA
jgi:putative methionine-R-sulfoxide reductase with GAF domain